MNTSLSRQIMLSGGVMIVHVSSQIQSIFGRLTEAGQVVDKRTYVAEIETLDAAGLVKLVGTMSELWGSLRAGVTEALPGRVVHVSSRLQSVLGRVAGDYVVERRLVPAGGQSIDVDTLDNDGLSRAFEVVRRAWDEWAKIEVGIPLS